jgi:ABC-type sugar transport system ATPase subunit
MAGIELKGITKRYPDGTEAVKDLNLKIDDGEFVILVGPSGCWGRRPWCWGSRSPRSSWW